MLGAVVEDVSAMRVPDVNVVLKGRFVFLESLRCDRHARDLWEDTRDATLWTHMLEGPFETKEDFEKSIKKKELSAPHTFFYAVVDNRTQRAVGYLSLMRADYANRVIEVGNVMFGRNLRRSPLSTEAQFLLAQYAFEVLHCRRYEWKCHSLNEGSQKAAKRLGFVEEGVFRQHVIAKGRNRDTRWLSMLDSEWPARKQALQRWLSPDNFDPSGMQKSKL